MDELASRQLSALAQLQDMFASAHIEHWLFGGWAVDFYVGSITRAHDDIDVAVWLDDLPRIGELLAADGWSHAPEADEDGGTGYERAGVRLELTFLVSDANGDTFIPLRDRRIPWPRDSFGEDVRELLGVQARLISRPSLLRGKSTERDDPDDALKDRADFRALLSMRQM
ncbi:MAG: nucleotidyltransferase domain-containing protein [Gaiellaceae bacterium]